MNETQLMDLLKQVLQVAGTIATAFGLLTPAETASYTTSILAVAGPIAMIGAVVWGFLDARKSKLVATVNAMPEVAGVVTTQTTEGRALANAVPSNTVAAAGTTAAANIATP